MTKQQELDDIAKEIEACNICRKQSIGRAVPGEGNPDAHIVFVGEAPGRKEAETGIPFVGRSGQLLHKYIQTIGLSEKDIYITSAVKYLPQKGTPSLKQIIHARFHLLKQLAIINPHIIVLLGKTAITSLLQEKVLLKKEHGHIIEKDNRKYLLIFHPAAVLRFPQLREAFFEDFRVLQNLIT